MAGIGAQPAILLAAVAASEHPGIERGADLNCPESCWKFCLMDVFPTRGKEQEEDERHMGFPIGSFVIKYHCCPVVLRRNYYNTL